ncbi:MAG: hypothetical protein Q8J64_08390 [Thermodesulfovibrionales bacterium]|nr:hypothetical protein [Thermodesulfovibrionales bacterium]
MNPFKVVSRSFSLRLLAAVMLTVVLGASITGVFFFTYTNQSLGESYTQRFANLSIYKLAVIRNSLYIYALFAVAIFVAVVLFSIYYSHKVTGPLYRIRMFAKEMERGNFGIGIRFREGDAIHAIAETANSFSQRYGEIYSRLNELVDAMEKDAAVLKRAIEKGDSKGGDSARDRIASGVTELNEILSGLKL